MPLSSRRAAQSELKASLTLAGMARTRARLHGRQQLLAGFQAQVAQVLVHAAQPGLEHAPRPAAAGREETRQRFLCGHIAALYIRR